MTKLKEDPRIFRKEAPVEEVKEEEIVAEEVAPKAAPKRRKTQAKR